MKRTSTIKKLTALLLSAILILLTSCSADTVMEEPSTGDEKEETVYNFSETTENVSKTETVYVNLDANGTPSLITVSDWLHADRGEVYINDTTTLKDFTVTRGQASVKEDNGNIVWQAQSSDVYYEGVATDPLPMSVTIKYFLDGAQIAAEDLPGKSGEFRMEITLENNLQAQVSVNGVNTTMNAPLVAVGGMMLSYENFSNIEVTNGMSMGGGTYEMVMLTALPGMADSLGVSGLNIEGLEGVSFADSFTVSATVTDFAMSDIYFAAIPLSSMDLDIEMPGSVGDIQQILIQLQDYQAVIEQIDPQSVLKNFVTDTSAVREMLDVMQKGLKVYNENEKMLNTMTELLTPENIETLTNFLNSIDPEEMDQIMSLMSNVSSLQAVFSSLSELAAGLEEVKPILDAFSAAMEDPEVAASMEKLPETLATMSELMNYLNENKELLDVMTKLMDSEDTDEMLNLFESMQNGEFNFDTTSLTDADAAALIEKAELWLQLEYSIYTSAPEYMDTSCTFIFKTDPIK